MQRIVIDTSGIGLFISFDMCRKYYSRKYDFPVYAYVYDFDADGLILLGGEPEENPVVFVFSKKVYDSPLDEEEMNHNIDDFLFIDDIPRDDKVLIDLVEEEGSSCNLKVVEIPDGVEWEVIQVNMGEIIIDKNRSWR